MTGDDMAPSIGQLQLWVSQIKDARESAGIPIETIADSLNLNVSFVAALENGRSNVHMEWPFERQRLQTVAKRLGVTLHEEVIH